MNQPDHLPPTAFLSYSWDDDTHKAWAREFASRLRSDGIDATLDQWATVPGDQLPEFMEQAISQNQFVLIVCTPRYKARSEARIGGVGYEGDIITAEIMQHRNHRKFIPILRRGEWTEAAPSWLAGKYYIDLRDRPQFDGQYQDLLSTVTGTRPSPPPLGKQSSAPAAPTPRRGSQTPHTGGDPVRIVGVIADEVTEPHLDGTRGSTLYKVPFRLSKHVSGEWAAVFEKVWNRPPRFTTMHRPGIASARGDRIILDGTTIEEVQKYHRETLVLCVQETNRLVVEHRAKQQRAEEERTRLAEQHRKQVRDVADEIRFDD